MSGTYGWFRQGRRLPWLGVAGAAALIGMGVACSKDKTVNPDAVPMTELKYPGNLTIADQGDGSVVLWWSGSNNEKDFDGYDVFGMQFDAAAATSALAGGSFKLLDDQGNPVSDAKNRLGLFDYDPSGKKLTNTVTAANWTSPPTFALADSSSGSGSTSTSTDTSKKTGPEFSARPIHTVSTTTSGQKQLPTCKPGNPDASGIATCTLTTDATYGKALSDGVVAAVNGMVKFTPDTLTVGSTYCFAILSSMSNGEKVSQTSSNIACVTPKYKKTFNLALPAAKTDNTKFDLTSWLAACTATACADPTTTYISSDGGSHNAASTDPIYVEYGGSGPTFSAGQNNGIQDLGTYTGFSDPTLPAVPPTMVLDTNLGPDDTTPIFNGGGYSLAGQSIPILKNHMYVFAIQNATTKTKFNYYWMFVSGDVTAGSKVAVEMRIPKNAM